MAKNNRSTTPKTTPNPATPKVETPVTKVIVEEVEQKKEPYVKGENETVIENPVEIKKEVQPEVQPKPPLTSPVPPVVEILPQPILDQQVLQNVQNQTLSNKVKNKVDTTMNGMSAMVSTPVANSLNFPKLAGVMIGSYVALEAFHHIALTGYVMPYLASTFALGATATNIILYGALGLGALGLSYLAYKVFFHTPKKVAAPVNGVQYTPVAQ